MPKYYGCPCEGCGRPLALTDDIVVCPDCGAPYHRTCYEKLGRCIHSVGGFAQKVNGTGGFVAAREQRVTLSNAIPDGGSIRQHLSLIHI